MKSLFLLAPLSLAAAGAAFAQSVEVSVPADVKSEHGARTYTTALDEAVKTLCRRAIT